MSREVRRVPPNWEHPKDDEGKHIPLFDGAELRGKQAFWDEGQKGWAEGFRQGYEYTDEPDWLPIESEYADKSFTDYAGPRPDEKYYMPVWSKDEATHYQMYENTTEGTPLSPVMDSPEKLARWLVDNKASSYAHLTASYERWLAVCKGDKAISGAIRNSKFISGVELAEKPRQLKNVSSNDMGQEHDSGRSKDEKSR